MPAYSEAQEAAVRIASAYSGRVAHIETVGTLFNNKEEVGSGSGLLIGEDYVLTNNHVVPPGNNYKNLLIQVRLKSRLSRPRSVESVERDAARDLALLKLAMPASDAPRTVCPMPVVRNPDDAPIGTAVYVLGFPLNEDLGINGGLISSHSAAGNRWRTDSLITYGSSGGPAFDNTGALVGIAVAGIGSFTVGGETRDVDGINFLIPTPVLLASNLMDTIKKIPQPIQCWSDSDKRNVIAGDTGRLGTLARTFTVRETKDNHPVVLAPHSRNYEVPFASEPGYSIVSCSFQASSANNSSDETCNVQPGGKTATFRFRLTSGPSVDRWRGWWGGTVTLNQRLLH